MAEGTDGPEQDQRTVPVGRTPRDVTQRVLARWLGLPLEERAIPSKRALVARKAPEGQAKT